MSQEAYTQGDIFFISLGPVPPSTATVTLIDRNGNKDDSFDQETGTLSVYDWLDQVKSWDVSVSGSEMTVQVDQDFPDRMGLYHSELIIGETGIRGWTEVRLTRDKQSRELLTVEELARYIGRYALGAGSGYISENDFQNWMLAQAYDLAVQEWNDTPGTAVHSLISFPHKAKLRDGAAGFAFKLASTALQRERMPAEAGGVSTDDKKRADYYMQEAEKLVARFRDWISYQGEREMLKNGWGVA